MALLKDIRMPNGITLNYHRIAMIKIDLNQQITLLVESYLDEGSRNYEKEYALGNIEGEPVFPYTDSNYIHIEYDEGHVILKNNIIQSAYEWLKTQPEFINSQNI